MKKILIPLLVAVSCGSTADAQTDSSHFDLGSVRLEKKFTQYMSVKGEALEKMPFANLAEAINVWRYGAYSNAFTLVYVVDGNIVPDVNAWSVYDIEEVVFVQSALTQLTGNTGQQQLVLITTRKQHEKEGKFSLRAAGSSALVNTDYKHVEGAGNASSETNMYHQYYVSGYYSREKLQLGVSADWLRDVSPAEKNDTFKAGVPEHINRYRFNAWANAKIGRKSNLYINVNATPENAGFHTTGGLASFFSTDVKGKENQFTVNPYLQFRTELRPGLQNNFSASYQSFNSHNTINGNQQLYSPPNPANVYISLTNESVHDRILIIRDHLSWALHAYNWTIEPAVYLQYAYIKQQYEYTNYLTTSAGSLGLGGLPSTTSINSNYAGGKGHVFTGAPSLDFSYKNILSFGGGGFAFLPPSGTKNEKAALFPFAHLSLDLLKLGNAGAPSSLQLFASLARNYNYSFNLDMLDDMTVTNTVSRTSNPSVSSTGVVFGGPTGITVLPTPSPGDLYAPHTVWTTGLGYRRPADKLVMNYYFEKRGFTAPAPVAIPLTGSSAAYAIIITYPALQAYTHHVDLMAKLVTSPSFQWQSGITATSIRVKGNMPPYPAEGSTTGDLYDHTSWTGGWINRIGYTRFFAGADVLYHTGEYQLISNTFPSRFQKINSFDLQNIYAGFKIQVCKTHEVELYLNSRNLAQNSASDLTDRRRYYGAGFKTAL